MVFESSNSVVFLILIAVGIVTPQRQKAKKSSLPPRKYGVYTVYKHQSRITCHHVSEKYQNGGSCHADKSYVPAMVLARRQKSRCCNSWQTAASLARFGNVKLLT